MLKLPDDAYRVVIESGTADVEIVRTAESNNASLIVVGAKPRVGTQRFLDTSPSESCGTRIRPCSSRDPRRRLGSASF